MGKQMKATIVESVMGAFGFSEDNTLVEKVFFPKDAVETANRLKKVTRNLFLKTKKLQQRPAKK
ncbi:MAG: hypothetical protein P8X87_07185 [Candidatus Bathyarchaeota archaeon]